jgi:hypothetical protein
MLKKPTLKGGLHMWKKIISIILAIAFVSLFTLSSAEAGSKQHYMWHGAGIALGVVTLGLMAHHLFTPPPHVAYPPPEPRYYPPSPPPEYVPGHWEMTREWVPGTWERVWVPGYYNRWGNWVAGHYEGRQTPGYYVVKRVWVEGYYRFN